MCLDYFSSVFSLRGIYHAGYSIELSEVFHLVRFYLFNGRVSGDWLYWFVSAPCKDKYHHGSSMECPLCVCGAELKFRYAFILFYFSRIHLIDMIVILCVVSS